jgi:hypothetical protein
MRAYRLAYLCFIIVSLLAFKSEAFAQAQPESDKALRQEIEQLKQDFASLTRQYGDRLAALEEKMRSMQNRTAGLPSEVLPTSAASTESAPPVQQAQQPQPQQPQQSTEQVPPGAGGAGGPIGQLPVYGGAREGSKIFNPDIAVIGDFLGATGSNGVNPAPTFEMHESEASFQAIVDPYARADFFLSFGENGVALEEGYLTFPTAPGGLLVRAGKMRAAFGKVNTLHNHVLPWTDRPIVTNNLVGGEDGIDDVGFSVAKLIPNRWIFLEATGQVYRGDSDEVFHSTKRGFLSYVGHLRGYQDLTDNTNIDLGVSYARGHNASGVVDGVDLGRFQTTLIGTDATIRWRPLQRSIYHSFVGRSEFIWSRRGQPGGVQPAMGYYVSGDYQFARRWFAGVRYDHSNLADNASLTDTGQSAVLTFWPSEFSQLRGQYRRTNYATGPTANEFLMQLQFSIGAHGAHPF